MFEGYSTLQNDLTVGQVISRKYQKENAIWHVPQGRGQILKCVLAEPLSGYQPACTGR